MSFKVGLKGQGVSVFFCLKKSLICVLGLQHLMTFPKLSLYSAPPLPLVLTSWCALVWQGCCASGRQSAGCWHRPVLCWRLVCRNPSMQPDHHGGECAGRADRRHGLICELGCTSACQQLCEAVMDVFWQNGRGSDSMSHLQAINSCLNTLETSYKTCFNMITEQINVNAADLVFVIKNTIFSV